MTRRFRISPLHEHLVRPRAGLSGEVWNLRFQVNEAMEGIEDTIPDTTAPLITDWYLDELGGDDGNTGDDPASALASNDELMRRLRFQRLDQHVIVHVLSSLSKLFVYGLSIGINGSISYTAEPTVVYTGTFTGYTPKNAATNQAHQVEDIALGDWGPYVGARIKITSGAGAGGVAWIAKNLGAGQARVSTFVDLTTLTPPVLFFPPVVVPSPGDTYVIETLPAVEHLSVDDFPVDAPGSLATDYARVVFSNLAIRTDASLNNNPVKLSKLTTRFIGCVLEGIIPFYEQLMAVGCCFSTFINISGSQGTLYAGQSLFTGAGVGLQGAYIVLYDCLFSENAYVVLSGSVNLRDECGFMETADDGMGIGYGTVYSYAKVWGDGNTGYGIDVAKGATFYLYAGHPHTITGTLGDWGVGGDVRTHAQVPYTNLANYAKVI